MLFTKKIEPRCEYCTRGAQLKADTVFCLKRGIVSPIGHCHSFRYDPLKRQPPRPIAPRLPAEDDFSL